MFVDSQLAIDMFTLKTFIDFVTFFNNFDLEDVNKNYSIYTEKNCIIIDKKICFIRVIFD